MPLEARSRGGESRIPSPARAPAVICEQTESRGGRTHAPLNEARPSPRPPTDLTSRFSGPRAASTGVGKFGFWLVKRLLGAASRKYPGSQMIPQQAHTHGGDRGWWWVQAKKGRERATRRAQAASVHVACAASCSLPFELPLCPLRGTPPALRVWSPLPSALLFWMPRSENMSRSCEKRPSRSRLGL